MFGSKAAIADANEVDDRRLCWPTPTAGRSWRASAPEPRASGCSVIAKAGWSRSPRRKSRRACAASFWSSAPGRKLGDVLREQLRANPANAPILDEALAAIDSLEAGKRVDASTHEPGADAAVRAAGAGRSVIDLMSKDPAALARTVDLPMLIVHGDQDLQISAADAEALSRASRRRS